jgi:hypothetical protein
MNAAAGALSTTPAIPRRAPLYGAALAVFGMIFLLVTSWPTRNPQPAGLAIALAYTAAVLTLMLSVRVTSLLESFCRMPLCGYLVLVVFAAVVAQKVGHWPWYSNPDPKDLHWPSVTAPVSLVTIVSLLSIPVATTALIVATVWRYCQHRLREHRKLRLRQGAWLGLGVAAWIYDLKRGGLLNWIMD